MAKKTKKSKARSQAAKKGWETRRRRQRSEHRRRSQAAKKGWKRRKAREAIKKKAGQPIPKAKGPLREFVVNFAYEGKHSRSIDFTVISDNEENAITEVYRKASTGQDSNGYNLTWFGPEAQHPIPWDEVTATRVSKDAEAKLDAQEIKALGQGWVEKH